MGKLGLCCISLNLKDQGYSFSKMTYSKFSSLPREEAISILGERIHNNLVVTEKTIRYCFENNLCYRVSSDLFPLITYDKANVELSDLPNYDKILEMFDCLKQTIKETKVRISAHPSEFNVLASTNKVAVDKTVRELNFFSDFFDRIGCEANHSNPMNLHINNKSGSKEEVVERFLQGFDRLSVNCKSRLTIENDDKAGCWSVRDLVEDFNPKTNIPICFDYLHHKCHADGLTEQEALSLCHSTWSVKPLFHYSESRIDSKNPRAHADYASRKFETYGLEFDVDLELKMKDKAVQMFCEN